MMKEEIVGYTYPAHWEKPHHPSSSRRLGTQNVSRNSHLQSEPLVNVKAEVQQVSPAIPASQSSPTSTRKLPSVREVISTNKWKTLPAGGDDDTEN